MSPYEIARCPLLALVLIGSASLAGAADPTAEGPVLNQLLLTSGQDNQFAYQIPKVLVMGSDKRFIVRAVYAALDSARFYQQSIEVYDGANQRVHSHDYEFKPENPVYTTWSDFSVNPQKHEAGIWQIELLLDGRSIGSTQIEVLAGPAALKNLPPGVPIAVGYPIMQRSYFDRIEQSTQKVEIKVDRSGKVIAVTPATESPLPEEAIFQTLAMSAGALYRFPPDPTRPAEGRVYSQSFDIRYR